MGVVSYRPTSPGRRHATRPSRSELSGGRHCCLSLLASLPRSGGRNNAGRITVRHVGGGHKRRYRRIDFRRDKDGVSARVERIEYDPNRSANIALLCYDDGERRYILAPRGLTVGARVCSGEGVPVRTGNSLPMSTLPVGSVVHNVEMKVGKGGQIARSAGGCARITSRDGRYVVLRLRSGELRRILGRCRATLGVVGNEEHMLRSMGKAGVSRRLGIRPTVRGTAMNPVDHPHGGGEGRNFGRHPVSPWGKQLRGRKTRSNKRTEKFILRRR